MNAVQSMFQNWMLKDFIIVMSFVMTVGINVGFIVWWGSRMTYTLDTLAQRVEVVSTFTEDLRIRMAVQEALNRNQVPVD